MKVRDSGVWHATQAELLVYGDVGREFLEFVTDWVDRAETIVDTEREFAQEDGSWTGPTPAEALRLALPAVEARYGEVNVSAISQGLIAIMGNWEHGEQIFAGLTIFEARMVTDMLSLKQLELARAAITAVDDPG